MLFALPSYLLLDYFKDTNTSTQKENYLNVRLLTASIFIMLQILSSTQKETDSKSYCICLLTIKVPTGGRTDWLLHLFFFIGDAS